MKLYRRLQGAYYGAGLECLLVRDMVAWFGVGTPTEVAHLLSVSNFRSN
jgi:hypothetical protein